MSHSPVAVWALAEAARLMGGIYGASDASKFPAVAGVAYAVVCVWLLKLLAGASSGAMADGGPVLTSAELRRSVA